MRAHPNALDSLAMGMSAVSARVAGAELIVAETAARLEVEDPAPARSARGARAPVARRGYRTVHRPARRPPRPGAGVSPGGGLDIREDAAVTAPAAAVAPGGNWIVPLLVVMIGSFMAVLDTSIVNIAIPTMENQLGASADLGAWVATGYNLALGVVVPTSGWLSERFGLDRVQNVALLLFVAGSALCGLSSSVTMMIVFRIFQAIGGGLLPAVSLTIVYRTVPPARIGTAMGIFGFGTIFAPAIGPALGGFLVQYSSWRLIYFINVPIGIAGAMLSYRLLPRFARTLGQRFDPAGWVTIAVGLFSLLLALSEGERWHWTSYKVLILLAVGVLSLALFVVIELSVEQPLLDLRIFRNATFAISAVLIGLLSNGLFAGMYFIPLFLQQGDGLSAFDTGLTLVPPVFVTMVMLPLSGQLFDRLGARWLAATGILLVASAAYLMHGLSQDTSRGQVMLWMALQNLGVGLAFIPIQTGSMSRLASAQVSGGSAINNIVQRVSGALGTAVLGALLTGYQAQRLAGQGALLPAVAPGFPQLQAIAAQGQAGVLFLYNEVQLRVFGLALGNIFLLISALTATGVLLALLLPSRQERSAEARAVVLE
jgi:EmrB/QacA subfamily drug resistance transporter